MNALLKDKPTVMVCPCCAQRLMEVIDVRWEATKIEFTYECSACGSESSQTVVQEIGPPAPEAASRAPETRPVPSKAIALLRDFQLFNG